MNEEWGDELKKLEIVDWNKTVGFLNSNIQIIGRYRVCAAYLQKSVSNIQIYLQKSVIMDLKLIFGMAESLILSMKEETMPGRFDLQNYPPTSGLIHW